MAVFPPEVVSMIMSWCDGETLFALTRVTRDAERHLYRLIHMNSSPQRCDALLTALAAADKRRVELVQGLRLMGLEDVHRTTRLLMRLRCLKYLNVTSWCGGFGLPQDGFPFRLRALRLFGECDMLTGPYLIAFLEQQTKIEVLELVLSEDGGRWDAVCARARDAGAPLLLPALKVLQARKDVIRAFLARPRPLLQHVKVQVQTYELVPPVESDDQRQPVEVMPELCTALTTAGNHLQSLTIGTCNVGDTMWCIPGAMPGLQSVDIMIASGKPFDKFCQEFENPDAYQWNIPVLMSLKRFVLHVVNVQNDKEFGSLAVWFECTIAPGMGRIMPWLKDCKLIRHRGLADNPTLLVPRVADASDRHPLDKALADQEFFRDIMIDS